ncbi:hypothetical protein CIP107534_02415 [Corynebacterium diphtheriae]|uniref:hypothetical protein n=1 Tax=Corynebacterium diphtheriae TaxID=1717 RepID=UPI0013CABBA6|nr:hypothetical protein CIP107534_02415 [Corynebacterium diphtheriae]CAB0945713.1 hypothetical protein FRC0477_00753 [Corynebacterium diphtheriae]CAB0972637.1 hypothetical protein FRC0482_01475 [Corynebacterium diphtheriae]
MQLGSVRESWGSENQKWLGSAHGTNACQTVTLDATKLTKFSKDGIIPSGIPLKKGTGGKFEPVTEVSDKLAGFLFTTQSFKGKADVIAPMLDHGRIRVEYLPEAGFTELSTLEEKNSAFVIVEKGEY